MVHLELSIEIRRPPTDVFAYVANFENDPDWKSAVRSVTRTSDGPLNVGSTFEQTAGFMGKSVVIPYEVTEFDPGTEIRYESTGGPFPVDIVRRVEPVAEGAQFTTDITAASENFFDLAKPVLQRVGAEHVRGDLAVLKAYLESREAV
ncbi:SRPBCC family protein [Haloarchaeobius sp. TZWWS8]|uniref:SRPBCC family protein n=1 Tax=Haloarchaeobius sp. TZWWS8 TaxID=3446121 RepID=UPI003EBAA44A